MYDSVQYQSIEQFAVQDDNVVYVAAVFGQDVHPVVPPVQLTRQLND